MNNKQKQKLANYLAHDFLIYLNENVGNTKKILKDYGYNEQEIQTILKTDFEKLNKGAEND